MIACAFPWGSQHAHSPWTPTTRPCEERPVLSGEIGQKLGKTKPIYNYPKLSTTIFTVWILESLPDSAPNSALNSAHSPKWLSKLSKVAYTIRFLRSLICVKKRMRQERQGVWMSARDPQQNNARWVKALFTKTALDVQWTLSKLL